LQNYDDQSITVVRIIAIGLNGVNIMSKLVTFEVKDEVGVITIDDGKVNVMSLDSLREINAALDRAEAEGRVVVLTGREGIFSAGFDLKVLAGGAVQAKELTRIGAETARRIMEFPFPVVAACTGHAFPMGAFLLLASDYRIGVTGTYKIGLNEVAIGITVPRFAIELAGSRLMPSWYSRTVLNGEMFEPEESKIAGFLDELVSADCLLETAIQHAVKLKGINMESYRATKKRAKGPFIRRFNQALEEDLLLTA